MEVDKILEVKASWFLIQWLGCITAAAKLVQSCPTLCDAIDGSPLGSAVPGILQARTLEWVAISFSNAWKWKVKVKLFSQLCLTLSDPMVCSLPGSSAHGIFQARVLEWGTIAFSVHYCSRWKSCLGNYTWKKVWDTVQCVGKSTSVFITDPPAKYHTLTLISGHLKWLFSQVPGRTHCLLNLNTSWTTVHSW